jgi:hypothetical protein
VVECTALEMRHGCKLIGGSNPPLSARWPLKLTTFFNRGSSGGEAIWMLTITPDAGSTQNNLPRKVALHSHLIEQGFPVYIASMKGKPLFYDPARGRGGSYGNPQ